VRALRAPTQAHGQRTLAPAHPGELMTEDEEGEPITEDEEDRMVIDLILASTGGVVPRKYSLTLPGGSYTYVGIGRFPMLVLAWMVIRHRWRHWRRGEGWRD